MRLPHGYAILSEIEERTEGAVRLGKGTLYSALKRLRSDGLIDEIPDHDGPRDGRAKRTYGLTVRGRTVLAEQGATAMIFQSTTQRPTRTLSYVVDAEEEGVAVVSGIRQEVRSMDRLTLIGLTRTPPGRTIP